MVKMVDGVFPAEFRGITVAAAPDPVAGATTQAPQAMMNRPLLPWDQAAAPSAEAGDVLGLRTAGQRLRSWLVPLRRVAARERPNNTIEDTGVERYPVMPAGSQLVAIHTFERPNGPFTHSLTAKLSYDVVADTDTALLTLRLVRQDDTAGSADPNDTGYMGFVRLYVPSCEHSLGTFRMASRRVRARGVSGPVETRLCLGLRHSSLVAAAKEFQDRRFDPQANDLELFCEITLDPPYNGEKVVFNDERNPIIAG